MNLYGDDPIFFKGERIMNLITTNKCVRIKNFIVLIVIGIFIAMSLYGYAADAQTAKIIRSGETWKVSETTTLNSLVIEDGAAITAPDGYSLTLTVNGVETGQKLVTTTGTETKFAPAIYKGNVILNVVQANPVVYSGLTFPMRQALFLDEKGILEAKSVLAAVSGKKPAGFDISNIQIRSTGESFTGVYVNGGSYTLRNVKMNLSGNGRSDFPGQGAAIVAIGEKTRLVVDGAEINNIGVVRTALIASGGSNVIVKNSNLKTMDGVLPTDYVPSTDIGQMRGGMPVGGSLGNCRATNLIGNKTQATYINSSISAEGWGVLSSDGCTEPKLTAINSRISLTGNIGGYGTYAIGNATERFLGCEFNVAFDVTSLKSGFLSYGDSTPDAVAKLNTELNLGLTDKELKAIPNKSTIINSERFGVVATGDGTIDVGGGTIFNTGETIFLNKGATVAVTVDGSKGAQLNAANGIIMQLMDNDGGFPYTESTEAPEKIASWDLTSTSNAATGIFSNITLKGDFYNSIGWTKAEPTSGSAGGPGGAPGGAAGGAPGGTGGGMPSGGMPGAGMGGGMPSGGMPGGGMASGGPGGASGGPGSGAAGGMGGMPGGGMGGGGGKNMVLTFNNASITGIISASEAHHLKRVINVNQEDYKLFGVVNNTAHEAINNGVIVSLTNKSNWIVTGTSYLTSLTIDAGSNVTALSGYSVTMTVDGVKKSIGAGTYKGQITLTIIKI